MSPWRHPTTTRNEYPGGPKGGNAETAGAPGGYAGGTTLTVGPRCEKLSRPTDSPTQGATREGPTNRAITIAAARCAATPDCRRAPSVRGRRPNGPEATVTAATGDRACVRRDPADEASEARQPDRRSNGFGVRHPGGRSPSQQVVPLFYIPLN